MQTGFAEFAESQALGASEEEPRCSWQLQEFAIGRDQRGSGSSQAPGFKAAAV